MLLLAFSSLGLISSQPSPELIDAYTKSCTEYSDIHDHIPQLAQLAKKCESVLELGLRTMVSSWGIFYGLANHSSSTKSYTGVDIEYPPSEKLNLARHIAESNGIDFHFHCINDLEFDPIEVDMAFIDSLHTYCHLTAELEKFSPYIRKYIALHDTSDPWGNTDDGYYSGDYSEYPEHIDRTKRGLWPAVEDFLRTHPEWILEARYTNCHGLTILKRRS